MRKGWRWGLLLGALVMSGCSQAPSSDGTFTGRAPATQRGAH